MLGFLEVEESLFELVKTALHLSEPWGVVLSSNGPRLSSFGCDYIYPKSEAISDDHHRRSDRK